jgi:hypothetical protein
LNTIGHKKSVDVTFYIIFISVHGVVNNQEGHYIIQKPINNTKKISNISFRETLTVDVFHLHKYNYLRNMHVCVCVSPFLTAIQHLRARSHFQQHHVSFPDKINPQLLHNSTHFIVQNPQATSCPLYCYRLCCCIMLFCSLQFYYIPVIYSLFLILSVLLAL